MVRRNVFCLQQIDNWDKHSFVATQLLGIHVGQYVLVLGFTFNRQCFRI